ncbi:MAG: preprotein translocase subunit YajC [Bacteroidales bacterium]|mgnify:CR=1 FL=1|nr:preprotein translocase subunit YajC [Bacteroidales bacterium]
MNMLTMFLQAGATGQAAQSANFTFFIMIILIFVIMWIFMIRPQKKQQKELENFRNSLKKGDKVVTVGGIHGTVAEVKETMLFLEIDQNVKILVDKASVVKDFSDTQK